MLNEKEMDWTEIKEKGHLSANLRLVFYFQNTYGQYSVRQVDHDDDDKYPINGSTRLVQKIADRPTLSTKPDRYNTSSS